MRDTPHLLGAMIAYLVDPNGDAYPEFPVPLDYWDFDELKDFVYAHLAVDAENIGVTVEPTPGPLKPLHEWPVCPYPACCFCQQPVARDSLFGTDHIVLELYDIHHHQLAWRGAYHTACLLAVLTDLWRGTWARL